MSPVTLTSLPNELLVHVFRHAHALSPLYGPPVGLTISQVSHEWREVAVNTSSLWSTIVLHHTLNRELLTLLLERNHSSPLDLYIDLRSHRPFVSRTSLKERVYAHLELFLPCAERWRALSIIADTDQDTIMLLVNFASLHVPCLTELDILVERHTRLEFPFLPVVDLFAQGAECLRIISLEGIPLRACWPPLRNVQNLALDLSCTSMTCADFARALGEMPSLLTLSIINYNFNLPPLLPPSTGGATQVQFHCPTLLDLSVVSLRSDEDYISRFWSIVSFPALESLSLTCNNDEDIRILARYAQFGMLRTIKLNHAENQAHISALAIAYPFVKELSVQWCDPSATLCELLPAEKQPSLSKRELPRGPIWPCLHTLSLSNVGGDVLRFLEAIIEHKATTQWPMKKLRIAGAGMHELGDEGRGDEEANRIRARGVEVEVFD